MRAVCVGSMLISGVSCFVLAACAQDGIDIPRILLGEGGAAGQPSESGGGAGGNAGDGGTRTAGPAAGADAGGSSGARPDDGESQTSGVGGVRIDNRGGANAAGGGGSSGGRAAAAGGGGAGASSSGRGGNGGRAGGGGRAAAGGAAAGAAGTVLGRGGARPDAGGGVAGAAGGASGVGASSGGAQGAGGTASANAPVIPAISGDCPTFATGSVSVSGLSGISLQVGAKRSGTGALLFYWHGTGSSASEVNTMIPSAVRSEILNEGGIIVSFSDSLGTGGDCSGTQTFSKDDFKVADLIAACAVRDHNIDPRRIYTTGCSAGGLQAGCMGALRSSYVAATVPNSGGVVTAHAIQDASRVPAVMTMHGGSSDRVIVSFSQTSATYDAEMKRAGAFVVNCDHGGGHCQAPSALYTAGWAFMKAHPFGIEPEPYSSALPASFPSYCEIY